MPKMVFDRELDKPRNSKMSDRKTHWLISDTFNFDQN